MQYLHISTRFVIGILNLKILYPVVIMVSPIHPLKVELGKISFTQQGGRYDSDQ